MSDSEGLSSGLLTVPKRLPSRPLRPCRTAPGPPPQPRHPLHRHGTFSTASNILLKRPSKLSPAQTPPPAPSRGMAQDLPVCSDTPGTTQKQNC